MLHSLTLLRERATPGASAGSINRIVARILNSFEENRTQSKIFLGVQENSTMTRYASSWSGIIRFLLRLLADHDLCPVLTTRYLELLSAVGDSLATIKQLAEALHAANPEQLSLQECLSAFDLDAGSDSGDSSTEPPKPLRLHATEFLHAVDEFSIALVRYRWEQSPFSSPVIGFAALHTLNEEGAWIPARNLSSRISG